MFTQSINFCTVHCHVLKSKDVIHEIERKWTVFSKLYHKIWVDFCLNTGKRFFSGLVLKPAEEAKVPLKNGARDL